MRRALALGLAFLLSTSAAALADGPKADLEATLENKEGGAVLDFSGKLANVPDGTKLHITLSVKNVQAEATFFMTPVVQGAFKARKSFPQRTLAPLSYVLRVELWIQAQRKAIGDAIRREWGLPSGAKIIVASKQLDIGTLEEQNAFRLETIHKLLEFVSLAEGCHKDIEAKFAEPRGEDRKAFNERMRDLVKAVNAKFGQPYATYLAKYVVIHERSAVSDLQNSKSTMGAAIADYLRGRTAKADRRLKQTQARLTRVKEELKSRLPGASDGQKQDASKEGEKKPAEESK